jgi:hypothetical protein
MFADQQMKEVLTSRIFKSKTSLETYSEGRIIK